MEPGFSQIITINQNIAAVYSYFAILVILAQFSHLFLYGTYLALIVRHADKTGK
jgi:hypothetical protein